MAPFLNWFVSGSAAAFVSVPLHSQKSYDCKGEREGCLNEKSTDHQKEKDISLNRLIADLGGFPSDLLRLDTVEGVRGVYVNEGVKTGDVLLNIPLAVCLRDDEPPVWLQQGNHDDENDGQVVQLQGWVTRLAASLLETQKLQHEGRLKSKAIEEWLQLLPASLTDCLPIHWSESILQSTGCRPLELAVESAFFARAGPLADLSASNMTQQQIDRALDLVQTRACRCSIVGESSNSDLRVLVPVFDMINHHYSHNAEFYREGEFMVVRAIRDIGKDEEVLISYGSSTMPVWKCLFSYGFVPSLDEIYEHNAVEIVVEEGYQFEVSPTEIPFELIQYHAQKMGCNDIENDVEFTPEIGNAIISQLDTSAKALEAGRYQRSDNDCSPTTLQLVADLRESHRRTLLACAGGLRDFIEEQQS